MRLCGGKSTPYGRRCEVSFADAAPRLSWPDWHAKMMEDLREERAKAKATAERSTRCADSCAVAEEARAEVKRTRALTDILDHGGSL